MRTATEEWCSNVRIGWLTTLEASSQLRAPLLDLPKDPPQDLPLDLLQGPLLPLFRQPVPPETPPRNQSAFQMAFAIQAGTATAATVMDRIINRSPYPVFLLQVPVGDSFLLLFGLLCALEKESQRLPLPERSSFTRVIFNPVSLLHYKKKKYNSK